MDTMFGVGLPYDLEIIEGHKGSSFFRIMPVKIYRESDIIEKEDAVFLGIVRHYIEEISIEEDVIGCFLAFFLKKYYDKALSISYRKLDDPLDNNEEFEWNLTYNVYHYETIRKMLQEIREVKKLLSAGGSNPVLDELLGKFPAMSMKKEKPSSNLVYQDPRWDTDWTVEDVVDFYSRFCNRLEKMMENSPTFYNISFMGP